MIIKLLQLFPIKKTAISQFFLNMIQFSIRIRRIFQTNETISFYITQLRYITWQLSDQLIFVFKDKYMHHCIDCERLYIRQGQGISG